MYADPHYADPHYTTRSASSWLNRWWSYDGGAPAADGKKSEAILAMNARKAALAQAEAI